MPYLMTVILRRNVLAVSLYPESRPSPDVLGTSLRHWRQYFKGFETYLTICHDSPIVALEDILNNRPYSCFIDILLGGFSSQNLQNQTAKQFIYQGVQNKQFCSLFTAKALPNLHSEAHLIKGKISLSNIGIPALKLSPQNRRQF